MIGFHRFHHVLASFAGNSIPASRLNPKKRELTQRRNWQGDGEGKICLNHSPSGCMFGVGNSRQVELAEPEMGTGGIHAHVIVAAVQRDPAAGAAGGVAVSRGDAPGYVLGRVQTTHRLEISGEAPRNPGLNDGTPLAFCVIPRYSPEFRDGPRNGLKCDALSKPCCRRQL